MKHRLFASTVCFVAATVAFAGAAAAEDAELKTSWGVPDLQGTWDFRSITPLERPAAFSDKATLTAEEAAAWEQRRKEERAASAARSGGDVDPSQGDVDVGYNAFWLDLGEKVSGTMRTSLVVDPPNGRLPALTADARRRSNERYALWGQAPAGPEERNTFERCILGFNAGPPMTPGAYNNMMEIFQSPGYVAIMTEMINDHRVIPTDGREHAEEHMRFWKGDSSGVWEGDTFVVTTKNYTEHTAFRGTGPNLVLTERFSRTGPDTLLYEYTVNDPESYEAPWTSALEMRRTDDPLLEYACHEGNRAMTLMLRGARHREQEGKAEDGKDWLASWYGGQNRVDAAKKALEAAKEEAGEAPADPGPQTEPEPEPQPEPEGEPQANADGDEAKVYSTSDVVPPRKVKSPKIIYPSSAQGRVIVQAVINEEGTVEDLKVLGVEASDFVDAALHAIERWEFEPAMLDGKPVPVYYNVTVNFGGTEKPDGPAERRRKRSKRIR